MKVKEMNIGGSIIEFYDDYILLEEEQEKQKQRVIRALVVGLERASKRKEETAYCTEA